MSVNVITVSLRDVVIIPQATKEYNLLSFLLLNSELQKVFQSHTYIKKNVKKSTPVHSFNCFYFM